MAETIQYYVEVLRDIINNSSIALSLLIGFLIIVLESILPFLPLAVFIAINKIVFGSLIGFMLSWVGTITGCLLSFWIFRYGFSEYFHKKLKNKQAKKIMNKISNIKFTSLVMISALPFTPAFSVNIAAGLSKLSFKKFAFSIIISKLSIVYFWGYIGTTFVESVTDIIVLIRTILLLVLVYLISLIINKKYDIE